MSELDAIAKRSDHYASTRQVLSERVAALNEAITEVRRSHIPGIKRALSKAAEAELALRELVEANPAAFSKPRTRIFNGVKVGFQKSKGVIHIADVAACLARIKRHLPDQVDLLINVKETPVKDALAQLDGTELKKLGVSITEAGDQVVIKPVDSDVDKMVDALLKDATDTEAGDA